MENKEKNSVEEQGKVSDFFATYLHINYNKCNHCGDCAKACQPGVLTMVNNELQVMDNAMQCNQCAKCLSRCRKGAISLNQSVR